MVLPGSVPCMNSPDPSTKILKALIAPARHSDGPTLYLICQKEETQQWEIHEHLPDGTSLVWSDPPVTGPQQAEAAIYGWRKDDPQPSR